MEGSFGTIPLTNVLEILHTTRRTGVLNLESQQIPLHLRFEEGEVVGGGILDWEGFEAIATFPLHPEEGRFRFEAGPVQGVPLMPFKMLLGEWARMNDQWVRFRSVLDSPSRVLETPRAVEPFAVFVGGRSVRAAARSWNVPLIIAAEYLFPRIGILKNAVAVIDAHHILGPFITCEAAAFTHDQVAEFAVGDTAHPGQFAAAHAHIGMGTAHSRWHFCGDALIRIGIARICAKNFPSCVQ